MMHTLTESLQRWQKDGSVERARREAQQQRDKAASAYGRPAPKRASDTPPPAGFIGGADDGGGGGAALDAEGLARMSAALDAQSRVLGAAATTIQKCASKRARPPPRPPCPQ